MHKEVREPKDGASKSHENLCWIFYKKAKNKINQTKQNTVICPVGLDKTEEFKRGTQSYLIIPFQPVYLVADLKYGG